MGKKRINDEKIWRPDVLLVERGSIVKGTVETTEEHLTLPGDIPDSPVNHMGKDLADRTLYLKEELEILRKYVDDVLACIQACSTGCKDTCLDMCLDTCKDGCKGTCKETCSTTCKGSCVDTCSGTCKGGCGDVCSGGCGNSCSTNCSTQCSGTCIQTCGGNCVGACVTGCSGCKGSCEGGCLTGCYTTCTGSCNTTCSTSCAVGCANNCAADCGGGCNNTCNNTCNTTSSGVTPTPTMVNLTLYVKCNRNQATITAQTSEGFIGSVQTIAPGVERSGTFQVKMNSNITISATYGDSTIYMGCGGGLIGQYTGGNVINGVITGDGWARATVNFINPN